MLGMTAQIFRNRTDNRTWFIQQFFPGENKLNTVHIVQQDANDHIVTAYIATTAFYHPENQARGLEGGRVVSYDGAGNVTDTRRCAPTPLITARSRQARSP